jgi:hypothetical protein
MAYSRFSYADVYVYMSVAGHLECCGCSLSDEWAYDSTRAMVDHIAEHRAAGHDVPAGLEDSLWEDDRDNWIDYRRCDVDGCEERVTCGSPAPSGYVSCCSLQHAQTLGGFPNFSSVSKDN